MCNVKKNEKRRWARPNGTKLGCHSNPVWELKRKKKKQRREKKEKQTGPFCSPQHAAVKADCFPQTREKNPLVLREKALFFFLAVFLHEREDTENRPVNNFSPTDTLAAWPQLVEGMKRGFEVWPSTGESGLWWPHTSLFNSVALPAALFNTYNTRQCMEEVK